MGLCFALILAMSAPVSRAQRAEYMDPELSAEKAKKILQQLITALGGQQFLTMKTSMCEGRYAQFGHNGDTSGYVQAKIFRSYPDKTRIEYGKKGNIVDVYAGEQGWTLDKGGVSEESAVSMSDYQEMLLRDAEYLVRYRLQEKDMLFRYGGSSVVNLREVEWVEITDSGERTFRLAVDLNNHLLVQTRVKTVDRDSRERQEDVTIYTNYQPKDGVQMPMQVTKERDVRRIRQAFYENCTVNPELPADLFTKASLEKKFAELGGKKK
jgi:outer membrane lipoprotein-sorting protein